MRCINKLVFCFTTFSVPQENSHFVYFVIMQVKTHVISRVQNSVDCGTLMPLLSCTDNSTFCSTDTVTFWKTILWQTVHTITMTSYKCRGISNHQQLDCLCNSLFCQQRNRGIHRCVDRARNAESVSMPLRHGVEGESGWGWGCKTPPW